MITRERDSQRSKLYDAEKVLKGWDGPAYTSVQDMQLRVNYIMKTKWWTQRYEDVVEIEVRDGRARRRACGIRNEGFGKVTGIIKMPVWSRVDHLILHEMIHVVIPSKYAAHGRMFAAAYLAIVKRFMDKGAAKELRLAFRNCHVKYVSKPSLSDEQRAAARERCLKMRSKA